jgi:uncharacterized membrane protein YsdA (DUF1294 family)
LLALGAMHRVRHRLLHADWKFLAALSAVALLFVLALLLYRP